MTTLIRIIVRNGTSILKSSVRSAHNIKILQGTSGEQIIYSPYEDATFPSMSLPEYVWKNVNNYSDRVALECGITGKKYTYGQARDSSNYISRSLSKLGIKNGDMVAIILPNLPETPIAFLGCLEAGAVVTTVNPYYTADELLKQLSAVSKQLSAVITSAEIASHVANVTKAVLPANAPFIVVNDGSQANLSHLNAIDFDDLIGTGKHLPQTPPPNRSPKDISIVPFSSGTTGLPKGVMLSEENLIANMEMLLKTAGGEFFSTSEEEQSVFPCVLPMFHIFGMNCVTFSRLAEGSKLITLPKFTPESYISVLEKNKVTGLFLVPPILLFLTSSSLAKKHHLDYVQFVFSGAAPLSDTDIERFMQKFQTSLKCCQGYGLTESSPVAFIEKSGNKYASIGKPVSSCRSRLVDIETKKDIIEPHKSGELWIAGPHIMKGYFNNEEATKETLENGWLKTGDVAYFDEEGDFFISDRIKELIKVKGFQVAPAELEGILRSHPCIEEAAVIGIKDAKAGELPKAFVQLKKDKNASEKEIQNFMIGKVSDFKELRGGVTFLKEIPKSSTGKILRSKLKQKYNS